MKTKFFFYIVVVLIACNTDYTPKPTAFIKLDFPEKAYERLDIDCPFIFEFPVYSKLLKKENSCSMDLTFPMQNGVLYVSYFPLDDNLMNHTQQSRKLAHKHKIIANGLIRNDSLTTYGMFYDYDQTSATSAQFYLTDSVNHFFRGALYFNTEVCDSILPINNFLKEDILHLIETFRWKDK